MSVKLHGSLGDCRESGGGRRGRQIGAKHVFGVRLP